MPSATNDATVRAAVNEILRARPELVPLRAEVEAAVREALEIAPGTPEPLDPPTAAATLAATLIALKNPSMRPFTAALASLIDELLPAKPGAGLLSGVFGAVRSFFGFIFGARG